MAAGAHSRHHLCRHVPRDSRHSPYSSCSPHQRGYVLDVFPSIAQQLRSFLSELKGEFGGLWESLGRPPSRLAGPGVLPLQELPAEWRVCGESCWCRVEKGNIPLAGGRSWLARDLFHGPMQCGSCVYELCEI